MGLLDSCLFVAESSRRLYQHRWSHYHCWCLETGCSVSHSLISKLVDFLLFLCKEKHLFVSAIRGYCSTLSAIFKYHLPDLFINFVVRDLVRSFELGRPSASIGPPSWGFVKVVEYLRGPVFELLSSKLLRIIMIKTFFWSPWLWPSG